MTLLGFGEGNLVFFDFEFSYVSIIGASISVFLGIVMTQSGFDKIFNWEGELDFITGKFAKTPLANFSTYGLNFSSFIFSYTNARSTNIKRL